MPLTNQPKVKALTLFCDGASRGNPGPASFGFVICEGTRIIAKESGVLGNSTNNIAEYEGLIRGLQKTLEMGATEVTIKADSELMIRQLNGTYKVRTPHIKELHSRALLEIQKLQKVHFVHIRREDNTLADELCNQALNES